MHVDDPVVSFGRCPATPAIRPAIRRPLRVAGRSKVRGISWRMLIGHVRASDRH